MSPKHNTLHMIGNAHLDPVWLWRWQEGFQEAKATFRSALDRMREYDDFLFTSSSAAIYEWIEHNDPEMFAEIKERVTEGRWEIVGGWWIQPDCNIPGGEAFVRQGLYGQRYFQEKLGVVATVGYNVDSFGHAGSLPQILLKSGLTSYVFMRPHPHEQALPSRLFWWESADASRVLTYRIPYEYTTWGKDLRQHVERCAAEFRDDLDRLMCFYGVGNHGGGPTRENIESIHTLETDPATPSLIFSTPSRYFRDVLDAGFPIPSFRDELQHHASGCYAAHSGVKRWNRKAENALITAETLSSVASCVTGQPYPDDFTRAWKGVLFNQFHDILAGTSIETAYDDARDLYGEAMAIAGRNLNSAVQSLSWHVNIPEGEGSKPIIVFNPHSWAVRANVEVEFGRLPENPVLLDADGRQTPVQVVRSLATVSSGSRNRLSFIAEVPPLGYTTYRLASREDRETWQEIDHGAYSLENEWFRLKIDPVSGCLSSLYDKRLDFELLRAEAAKGLVIADPSDTWSHGVLRFDDVVGEFKANTVELIEQGSVKSVLRVRSEYATSKLTQDFTVYSALPYIEVNVTVDWREQFKMLKFSFPVNVFFSCATYEIPYGTIQRPCNGEEEAGGAWVDLTGIGRGNGERLGLSILNDGKYSFSVTEKEIRLTVLRSPIYAHHDPYIPQPDRDYSYIDQGIQHFTYSLIPHAGGWQEAGTVQRAAELNLPLIAQVESAHRGPLPLRDSFLSIEASNVVLTALKRAEDDNAVVVRCLETAGIGVDTVLHLPAWNRVIEAHFNPYELKTFKVPSSREEPVVETNLIEWT